VAGVDLDALRQRAEMMIARVEGDDPARARWSRNCATRASIR
jgi:hypothetical protein